MLGLIRHQMSPILEVRVFGHLIDEQHTTGCDFLFQQRVLGFLAALIFAPLRQHGVGLDLHVVPQAICYQAQAGVFDNELLQVGPVFGHRLPDAVPQPVVAAAHHQEAIAHRVHGVDVDSQVPVAVARPDAAVEAVPQPVVVNDADVAVGGRVLNELALAGGLVAVDQRCQGAVDSTSGAHVIQEPQTGARGPATESFRCTCTVGETAGALSRRLQLAGAVLGGTPLAALAQPYVDQSRVNLGELAVANAPLVELARRVVLHQDVGLESQAAQDLLPFLRLQVQGDGQLVAALLQELRTAGLTGLAVEEIVAPATEGHVPAGRISADGLHHDRVGPHLREHR